MKIADELVSDVQINGTSVVTDGVAEIPLASTTEFGVIKVNANYGTGATGTGYLQVMTASSSHIKSGYNDVYGNYRAIPFNRQHEAAFYGLAKAAGADEKDSTLPVGTYTDNAKTAIKNMLGVTDPEIPVEDVQINGTSIVSDGVAEIPYASSSVRGVVRGIDSYGINILGDGTLKTVAASSSAVKAATHGFQPIVPLQQHESAFYGLAKAAGDTTQSQSSNPVGTYTDNAKSAIKAMLDIGGETQTVQVTGTTPTITANQNTRYVCGEVTSLDFTPSASGICDVIFTSGSTVTVLTLPNTVKLPAWFDATALETDTTYEISISDGIYGTVMVW